MEIALPRHALVTCSSKSVRGVTLMRGRGWGSESVRAVSFSRQKMLPLSGLYALTLQWTQPSYDQHINALLSTEGADWGLPGLT